MKSDVCARTRTARRWLVLLAAVFGGGCTSLEPQVAPATSVSNSSPSLVCPPRESAPTCPVCPVCAPVPQISPELLVPPPEPPLQAAIWEDLPGWSGDDLTATWAGFLRSCGALKARSRWAYWQPVCDAAAAMPAPTSEAIRQLFQSHLRPWALVQPDGTREGLITGYYEPILHGDRQRTPRARHRLLGVPDDMLTIDFGDLYPELKSMRLRGRVQGTKVVPYFDRAQIRQREDGPLASKTLAWVEDPVELFFLHIQGSGRVQFPDGTQFRVGYADQNGHPYQSIGRLLIERGELKLEQASMQGIQAWARANPGKLDEVLNANPSYVFFRELPGPAPRHDEGPPGALAVALTPERSIAVDPRTTPLGAPVFLATTQPNSPVPLNRLMLAQDTGGAIKGVVRADFFWGLGHEAGQKAGRMRQKGRMWVLLPLDYPLPENGAAALSRRTGASKG